MEIVELEQLVQLVRESNAGELTIRQEGSRVTIRKSATQTVTTVTLGQEDDETAYITPYGDTGGEADAAEEDSSRSRMVIAPLVGIFAHVKPLVGLNARVSEGQVIGIIEAMKLTTEIKAPVAGTILDTFIEAGHPVEYGQALFELLPDG